MLLVQVVQTNNEYLKCGQGMLIFNFGLDHWVVQVRYHIILDLCQFVLGLDSVSSDEEMLCKCFDKCCKAFIQS